MKYLLTLLLIFAVSCSQDFNKPHYRKKIQTGTGWKRKSIHIIKQGTFRDPNVKKDARQKLLQPPKINLDPMTN